MSSETALAFQWVYATASADTALVNAAVGGIWQGTADIGTVSPYMSYGRQSGDDVDTMNKVRLWAEILMQIVAVGPTATYAAMVIMANRIDALFKDVRNVGLPGGGGILACFRDSELALDLPPVNGAAWAKLGGLYRIQLQGP